jgi:hypothetical protein
MNSRVAFNGYYGMLICTMDAMQKYDSAWQKHFCSLTTVRNCLVLPVQYVLRVCTWPSKTIPWYLEGQLERSSELSFSHSVMPERLDCFVFVVVHRI